MKWFLLLVVIGMSVQIYRQQSQLDEVNKELVAARATITELQNQPKKVPLNHDSLGTLRQTQGVPGGPRGSTLLDVPAKSTR